MVTMNQSQISVGVYPDKTQGFVLLFKVFNDGFCHAAIQTAASVKFYDNFARSNYLVKIKSIKFFHTLFYCGDVILATQFLLV